VKRVSRHASSPLRWFPEFLELGEHRFRSQGRLFLAATIVGVVAGLAAVVFSVACGAVTHVVLERTAGYVATAPEGEARFSAERAAGTPFHPLMLLLLPALGGLLTGLIIFRFAPEAEGHGTDAAIASFHHHEGRMRRRVPLVKLVASAVTIGTGGSGGREGPIAQIGAGFGSMLADLLRLRPSDRRVLLAAGMGAGVSAIFRAPLAGALFAAEVLYSSTEFERDVILPAGLASVISYCTFGIFYHWRPLFETPQISFDSPWQLLPYLLLAVFLAFLAMLYTRTFYAISRAFAALRWPRWAKPMLGGFLTGAVGLALYLLLGRNRDALSVLSFGYGVLQDGFRRDASIAAGCMLAIALGKILTTSLTIGSGGSGGVFGPSMVIGGCGGGALGAALHHWWPGLVPHPAAFMIVGMAGFFAAAAKTPFSTLVIVSEMTGDYRLLLPALWVCAVSFLLSDEESIYSSQVESRSRSPAHRGSFIREMMGTREVREFLAPGQEMSSLAPGDPLPRVIERLAASPYSSLPVVDRGGRLLGVVDLEEVHDATRLPVMESLLVAADIMRTDVEPLEAGHPVDRALELFVENDLLALPVVEGHADRRVIGVVHRADIARSYLEQLRGRERGSVTPPPG
jgi:chloride channel protein, CIC family